MDALTKPVNCVLEEIRRLFDSVLARNGGVGQEFQYDVRQGPRRVRIDVGSQPGPRGSFAKFKIEEK